MPTNRTIAIQNERTPDHHTLIITSRKELKQDQLRIWLNMPIEMWNFCLEQLANQSEIQIYLEQKKISIHLLPSNHSRHNSWTHANFVRRVCSRVCNTGNWDIVLTSPPDTIEAHIASASKAFPIFSAKSSKRRESLINIIPLQHTGGHQQYQILIDNIRLCGSLVDQPPNYCHIPEILELAKEFSESNPNVTCTIIQGKELQKAGLNGVWSVGKAAIEEPALLCLQWNPTNVLKDSPHLCWVGKGVIYDTGGLSLKSKTGMPGMKIDMAGAAAVFTAFKTIVEREVPVAVSAILCLAENAINSRAIRPDDIITMYSGKTVEVNNTDAEGRLVLADGLAWAESHLSPDVLIDLATLTGAAATSVGRGVCALYCNDDKLEELAIVSGKCTGEVCFPLPYIPEKWKLEFKSTVADMRNSVATRNNAQSACAGQFIGNHLSQKIPWLHIDIAPAAKLDGKATGVGVHLLTHLTESYCKHSK